MQHALSVHCQVVAISVTNKYMSTNKSSTTKTGERITHLTRRIQWQLLKGSTLKAWTNGRFEMELLRNNEHI